MRKLFSLFAAVTLSVGLWALDNVPYVDMEVSTDAEGHVTVTPVAKIANNVTEITNQSDLFTLEAGWYIVYGADVQTSTLICNGAVHLILADGAKLTATGKYIQYFPSDDGREGYAGIQVSDEAFSLTIYGQTDQSGQLFATGGWKSAGIGGGRGLNGYNITINGGTVTAAGDYGIFGHGDSSAGIGGGCVGDGINITINAGKVTAESNGRGAGIGAGEVGSALGIVINGGEVTTTSRLGSGIGNGCGLPASDITINGGTVTANGCWTGIGGNNITITDGTVEATGAAGIGGDGITINGGMVTANGGIVGNGNTINDGTVEATGGKGGAGISGGITINGGTVEATGGEGDNTLGLGSGAGIGGGSDGSSSGIRINGGTVTATGGPDGGAGIGGGAAYYEDTFGSDITITGGTVIATGGELAAGIGGGDMGFCSNITISGGTVTAIGGEGGAGIGSGSAYDIYIPDASNITISGGLVTAIGGEGADGIGRGAGATASDIKIPASLPLLADNVEEPTTFIAHAGIDDTENLAGKRFVTTEPRVRTNYATDKTAYYSTFYFGGMPLKLESEDVTMYTAALGQSGAETVLGLYEIEGDILPAGTPVVIEAASAEKVHFTPYYGKMDGITVPTNSLRGVDEETAVSTLGAGTIYTLAAEEVAGDITTAFYKYTGTTVAAHKAYLQLPVVVSAPRRITFGANTATGMENAASEIKAEKILRDGQLLIKKNGHLYNVQGAIVK